MAAIKLSMPRSHPLRSYDLTGKEIAERQVYEDVSCDICHKPVKIMPMPSIDGQVYCLDCLRKEYPDWWLVVPEWVLDNWYDQAHSR
jgi:formylmethanofuran dehydrogenase subunit E